jgi:hypothetical protein
VQAVSKPLSDLAIWVIDCQTTGASPSHGVVLEIGWGLCRADSPGVERAEAHWVALPPGERVSARVRQLTGFDEAVASVSLDAIDVWRRLRAGMEHAERAPAAIHFAQFELAFLRDWSSRFEPHAAFPFDAVCLHAIASRLHPDLPRQSLRALAVGVIWMSWICVNISSARGVVASPAVKWPLTRFFRLAALPTYKRSPLARRKR